jgi:hypothetical protein
VPGDSVRLEDTLSTEWGFGAVKAMIVRELTAAAMMEMDLIISVDTSCAHLAGALGRPLWILTPACPDWRWMLRRDDSPWYPGARLFRQLKLVTGVASSRRSLPSFTFS